MDLCFLFYLIDSSIELNEEMKMPAIRYFKRKNNNKIKELQCTFKYLYMSFSYYFLFHEAQIIQ